MLQLGLMLLQLCLQISDYSMELFVFSSGSPELVTQNRMLLRLINLHRSSMHLQFKLACLKLQRIKSVKTAIDFLTELVDQILKNGPSWLRDFWQTP